MKTLAGNRLRLVAVLAGLNLVLAVGGWLLLVAPQRHHASSAAQQLQQTRDQLSKLGASAQQARAKQPLIKTADLYRLAQAMPTTADEPDLMLGLDQLARLSGVKVLGISPLTPSQAAGGYTQLPLTLTLQGTYGSLTRYLHRLRTLVSVNKHGALHSTGRLFSVQSVVLTPAAGGKEEQATVALEAFVYGTVAGATPLPSTSTTSTTTTTG